MSDARLDIHNISEYFQYILDIPNYYVTTFPYALNYEEDFPPLATINDVKVYVFSPEVFIEEVDFRTNSNLVLVGNDFTYYMHAVIDDFQQLIINDIIKTLGGVFYEKTTLLY